MRNQWKFVIGLSSLALLLLPPGSFGAAEKVPDQIIIGSLSQLFQGAEFDHSMHVDLAGDCVTCHHHTTGAPVTDKRCIPCHQGSGKARTVTCTGCHPAQPFSAETLREKEADWGRFHVDKPGLKAAYHLNCLGCHKEMGGPVGCQDCHKRTEEGNAYYRTGIKTSKSPTKTGH